MESESTCSTLIRAAASGDQSKREEFVRRYGPVIRSYFESTARTWLPGPLVDDAVQDVFIECFRVGGVLDRVDDDRPGGFRAFLFGVVRNVGLRIRMRQARQREKEAPGEFTFDAFETDETDAPKRFDEAWAEGLMKEAATVQAERARSRGVDATRRVELLRLRFFEALPIRDIAQRWGSDPATLHREYAKARGEFRDALREVVSFDHPGTSDEIDARCLELLILLGRR